MDETNLLHLELLLQQAFSLVQSTESVDFFLIFASYMGVVACRGFLFLGELDMACFSVLGIFGSVVEDFVPCDGGTCLALIPLAS